MVNAMRTMTRGIMPNAAAAMTLTIIIMWDVIPKPITAAVAAVRLIYMSKGKVKKTAASKKTATRAKKKGAARKSVPPSDDRKPYNLQQVEQIFNKGLDVAEAGVELGVSIVTKLGSLMKDQILEKVIPENITEKVGSEVSPGGGQTPNMHHEAGQEAPVPDQGGQMSHGGLCLSNRLPVFQGGTVSMPFSINNDSADSVKKIRLGTEGFIGEIHKYIIDGRSFSLKPSKKNIAPMDFDKFVLTGPVPVEAPDDTYHGLIHIYGEEGFRIPVMLVVSKKP
jgi:hypothetical protein